MENIYGAGIGALGVALSVGTAKIFHACKAEGGMAMACHWSEQAIIGVGIALIAASLFFFAVKSREARGGLMMAATTLGALAVAIPHGLIGVCAMPTMHCNAFMLPAATVFGSAVIAVGAVGAWRLLRQQATI